MNDQASPQQRVQLTAPIVGMHFRPPAKDVIALLPAGVKLELRRQPDNEYDPFAVQVFLHGFAPDADGAATEVFYALATSRQLERGDTTFDVLVEMLISEEGWTDPLQLGYIDSKKTGMAKLFSEHMDAQAQSSVKATLSFGLTGNPMAVTELESWGTPESQD